MVGFYPLSWILVSVLCKFSGELLVRKSNNMLVAFNSSDSSNLFIKLSITIIHWTKTDSSTFFFGRGSDIGGIKRKGYYFYSTSLIILKS